MKNRTKSRLPVVRPELRVVRPLNEGWRAVLDDVATKRGFPTSSQTEKTAALVAKLSAAYNASGTNAVDARSTEALAARLLFSFPRDVPKSAATIRELVVNGAIAIPSGRPLRVLDLGTGLGATSWGVARALSTGRAEPLKIEVTWVDDDAAALGMAETILDRATRAEVEPNVQMILEAKRATSALGFTSPRGTADSGFDLILAGQVLSELDRAQDEAARAASHAARLATWLGWLRDAPGTALVIVEPALRERTRHLHRVRDQLLAATPNARVLVPCLHDAPCPALLVESEWCHDEVPVDLPEWLVPIARGAGLRWQGLSFAPLVLTNDRAEVPRHRHLDAKPGDLRVISDPLVSKGKVEAFVCLPGESSDSPASRLRVMRLDRDADPRNEAWDELARGDRLHFDPPFTADENGRVRLAPETAIDRQMQRA